MTDPNIAVKRGRPSLALPFILPRRPRRSTPDMFTLSRTARITLLLVIDIVFFFVELIAGQHTPLAPRFFEEAHTLRLSHFSGRLRRWLARPRGRQLPHAERCDEPHRSSVRDKGVRSRCACCGIGAALICSLP